MEGRTKSTILLKNTFEFERVKNTVTLRLVQHLNKVILNQ